MASVKLRSGGGVVRSATITVSVDQRLSDMLVVTYRDGSALYRGVLMNTSRQNIPCGIQPPALPPHASVAAAGSGKGHDEDEGKLAMLSRRMTYFWSSSSGETLDSLARASALSSGDSKFNLRRTITLPAKFRDVRGGGGGAVGRLGVRLRPRNVLCNKCRSVCNERNENVSAAAVAVAVGVAASKPAPLPDLRPARGGGGVSDVGRKGSGRPLVADLRPKPCSVDLSASSFPLLKVPSLVLCRADDCGRTKTPPSTAAATTKKALDFSKFRPVPVKCVDGGKEDVVEDGDGDDTKGAVVVSGFAEPRRDRRPLRKRASVGSMEDLWDEHDFECGDREEPPAASAKEEEDPDVILLDPPPRPPPDEVPGIRRPELTTEVGVPGPKTVIKISVGPNGQPVLKIPAPAADVSGDRDRDNGRRRHRHHHHHHHRRRKSGERRDKGLSFAAPPDAFEDGVDPAAGSRPKRKKRKKSSSRDEEKRRRKKRLAKGGIPGQQEREGGGQEVTVLSACSAPFVCSEPEEDDDPLALDVPDSLGLGPRADSIANYRLPPRMPRATLLVISGSSSASGSTSTSTSGSGSSTGDECFGAGDEHTIDSEVRVGAVEAGTRAGGRCGEQLVYLPELNVAS